MDSVKTCLEPLRQKSLLIILIKSETSSAFAEKKPIFASFMPAVPERVEPLPGDFASGLCRRIAAGQRSAPYCFGLSSLFGFFEHTGKLFQCDGFQKYGGKILLREVIGCLDICRDCYDFQVCRLRPGMNRRRQFGAVHPRHPEVRQDRIDFFLFQQRQRLLP